MCATLLAMTDAIFDFPAAMAANAAARPDHPAVICGRDRLNWGAFVARAEKLAGTLADHGVKPGDSVASIALSSVDYAVLWAAVLRLRATIAPLAPSSTPDQIAAMVADSGAQFVFVDAPNRAEFGTVLAGKTLVDLDRLNSFIDPTAQPPALAPLDPAAGFNIIYSSGTTGTPKGIVHSRQMRWLHATVGTNTGYGEADAASFAATPLYSNTTLAIVIPTLAYGGTLHIMPKFDVTGYLERAQAHRITHTMLVPVQYKRLMEYEGFNDYDLSSYRLKYCTSAPFAPALKADVLKRWPGGLVEIYSMTEGGVVCLLLAHEHPDKLHTVGIPWKGSEVFTIDEAGNRLPPGETGELVGRSATMMSGYQNQPEKTREGYWIDSDGSIWQRMGDIGRVDADGFVELLGRSKDMIISGGFNIYPVDLEGVLLGLPGVEEAAVIGMASERWGETPVGFVSGAKGVQLDTADLLAAANAQLGKTQRLSALHQIDEMPRSHIGKLLKTDLRAIAEQMEAA